MKITYEGFLHTRSTHQSGAEIETDAPKDNFGKGSCFSPTDLLAASLGSCVLTLMGIVAQRLNLDLKGTVAEVEKEMALAPVRRIGRIVVNVHSPLSPTPESREKMEHAALTCPVKASLHPDMILDIQFNWGATC